MNIAIVNDNTSISDLMKHTVSNALGHTVIWTAENADDAIKLSSKNPPDLILMDLIMPGINGAQATKTIMENNPCAILIATASVSENAALVFEAMGYGALDAVNTILLCDMTEESINTVSKKLNNIEKLLKSPKEPTSDSIDNNAHSHTMIAIGASTGGPGALAIILKGLPADLNASVVIVQHVDSDFSDGLSSWLNSQTGLSVNTAVPGMHPEPGNVYLSATDDHLIIDENTAFQHTSNPATSFYRPSVDVFYESLVRHWNDNIIGVLLTGMGADGASGLKLLRDNGALTIAQDEASCAVFGMPKAAIDIGAADAVLPVDEISGYLVKQLSHVSHPQISVKQ